ncbi:MAG: hemolysin family protein [Ilumatobacteraceae bacterium]
MIATNFDNIDVLMLAVIFLLLIVLIFMSVAEMGLSRMTKPKAASLADKGHRSAKALIRLVADPERWVNPLLLTVNICQTVQATLTGIVAGRLFGTAGVIIGVFLNVLVFFVLAEAVPKTYAVIYSERAALITARPVAALVAFPPLQLISRGLISLTNVIVRGKGLKQGPFVSEQELLGIVEAAADDEVIEQEEMELVKSIIEFGDTVVHEVMVPRPDMVTLDESLTVTAALDVALEHGISRLPVLRGEGEDVVGLAFIKDLVRAERTGGGERPVTDFLRSVKVVPEGKPVSRLMREMQAEKFHLALVADEYGELAGVITLEDCLEELVGEIVDEHDDETAEVQRLADGDYLVDGGMDISDLDELLDLHLPDVEWDTVGGFLFGTLEHVPVRGESIVHDGWRFTAAQVEGRRIRRVRVSLQSQPAAADPEAISDGRDTAADGRGGHRGHGSRRSDKVR